MKKYHRASGDLEYAGVTVKRLIINLALREIEDIVPLVTPIWLGCKIGRNLSVMRDQSSGQLLVWGLSDNADHLAYLEAGIGTLFSQPSQWLTTWMTGIARQMDGSTPGRPALKAHEIDRAVTAFARSTLAERASARVLESLDIAAEDLELALRLDPQAKGSVVQVRFGVMQNVLKHRDCLQRLGSEQPQWLRQAAAWIEQGSLHPNRDVMAQIKASARTHGLSDSAWRALAKRGDALMGELPATCSVLDDDPLDEAAETPVMFHAATARHWIGEAWQELHPEFRGALVRALRCRPGNESMEKLLRAIGRQVCECTCSLDELTVLENTFSEMVAAIDAQREDDEDFALEYEQVLVGNLDERDPMPSPPKSTQWRNWECWLARVRTARDARFWVPLHSVEGRSHIAFAIESRVELIQEGERMQHCVAGYAKRCAAGRYVVYTVLDTDDAPVATLGLSIQVGRDDAGELVAQSARIDEMSGYDNDGVSRDLRRFSEQVVCEVNRRLPQRLPERHAKRAPVED
jgi:hypothetical protein